jgi:hypothetical protein
VNSERVSSRLRVSAFRDKLSKRRIYLVRDMRGTVLK